MRTTLSSSNLRETNFFCKFTLKLGKLKTTVMKPCSQNFPRPVSMETILRVGDIHYLTFNSLTRKHFFERDWSNKTMYCTVHFHCVVDGHKKTGYIILKYFLNL